MKNVEIRPELNTYLIKVGMQNKEQKWKQRMEQIDDQRIILDHLKDGRKEWLAQNTIAMVMTE